MKILPDGTKVPDLRETGDPKYGIDSQRRLCNMKTGEPIPDDEPIFILRAKDRWAFLTLEHYATRVLDDEHKLAVYDRIELFGDFADGFPERMKEPDT